MQSRSAVVLHRLSTLPYSRVGAQLYKQASNM